MSRIEKWLGPVLFGAAGFAFAVWVLLFDSRRMGFVMPRSREDISAERNRAGRKRQCLVLLVVVATAAAIPASRRILAAFLVVTGARFVTEGFRRRKRQAELRREWPFLIESMAVAALSGLDSGAAFQSAAKRAKGALREESDKVVLRLMGGSSLSRALSSMEEAGLPDVGRLRTMLSQSEILGTPVAGMLKSLSDEGYDAERQNMEERFNSLPLKLSAITVFFLLPPVLAVSVVPHILVFLEARW